MFCIPLLYRQGHRIEEAASTLLDTASEFEQAEKLLRDTHFSVFSVSCYKGQLELMEERNREMRVFFLFVQIPNCEVWAGLLLQKIPMISSRHPRMWSPW